LYLVCNVIFTDNIDDGFWKDFIASTKDKTPQDKAVLLEDDKRVETAHEESANEGSSNKEASTDFHFLAFVEKNGTLYEMDGRKKFPLNRGPSSPDTLLHDAAQVIKKYMSLNPDDVNFTVVALSAL
jgi:ubiquitin carboxyl-terminal hydrolase L3